MTTMVFCDFLLGENDCAASVMAAPMAVPCVGAKLVLMLLKNSFAELTSLVMGICM